jgi:hypothetical protein
MVSQKNAPHPPNEHIFFHMVTMMGFLVGKSGLKGPNPNTSDRIEVEAKAYITTLYFLRKSTYLFLQATVSEFT